MKLSDEVRRAVDDSGLSRYRICKLIGLGEPSMSRFMSGQGGLSMVTLDALADLLGLDVVARGKRRRKAKVTPKRRGRKAR